MMMGKESGFALALLVVCWGCAPAPAKTVSEPNDEIPSSAAVTADDVEEAPAKAGEMPLIQLTSRAAEHVRGLIAKEPGKDKLRISLVEKFGGDIHWNVSLTNKVDAFDDVTCSSRGITIVVDQASQKRVAGTKVDFEQNAFRFQSPQLQTAR